MNSNVCKSSALWGLQKQSGERGNNPESEGLMKGTWVEKDVT